ncbi:hypothetical protein MLD38_040740 [Melastoma candidum]|nr:hypothetical protein MLD38_040740 [Melastoma candidum]
MVPSRASGGLTQSPSSSGIYYQGDGQSQALANSPLSSPFCNSSSNSVAGIGHPNLGSVSGDMNNATLNSVANSGTQCGSKFFGHRCQLSSFQWPSFAEKRQYQY